MKFKDTHFLSQRTTNAEKEFEVERQRARKKARKKGRKRVRKKARNKGRKRARKKEGKHDLRKEVSKEGTNWNERDYFVAAIKPFLCLSFVLDILGTSVLE